MKQRKTEVEEMNSAERDQFHPDALAETNEAKGGGSDGA